MIRTITALAATLLPAAAIAADPKPLPRPALFKELVDCRAIAGADLRLQCFDAAVAKLEAAEKSKELVIVDQAEVRKARRGLFGLRLPDLGGLFSGGGGEDRQEGVSALGGLDEITATIKSAKVSNYGRWSFQLDDGATWVQTESRSIRSPKPGQKIRIRKAALGGFLANVNDQTAIRVMRVN